jgi:hypothetical protein
VTSVAIPQPFNASTAKGAMTLITDDGDGDHIGRMSCALRLVCLMRRLRNEIDRGVHACAVASRAFDQRLLCRTGPCGRDSLWRRPWGVSRSTAAGGAKMKSRNWNRNTLVDLLCEIRPQRPRAMAGQRLR